MKKSASKFLGLIGPYPYNPLLIFAFFSACYFSRFIPVIIKQPHGLPRYITALIMLLLAIVPSLSFAVAAFLIQKYRRWSSSSLLIYICEVAFGQSLLFIFAPLIRNFLYHRYQFEYEAPLTLTIGFYFGSLAVILVCLALLHRAELSIIKRLESADKLAIQLQRDREELIFSDEELRKQTSQFLHDRVQSDLMVVAMKLKSIQGQTSPEVDVVISKAIARLESTRTADLRNLVQVLTPNFAGAGLGEALKNLKEQYCSSMDLLIHIASDLESLSEGQRLGIFRIVEQALLNALVHGPASQVWISITTDKSGVIRLQVRDNGPGAQIEEIKSGVGSAIVDSWVSILKGKKEVMTKPGEGYSISVTFNR